MQYCYGMLVGDDPCYPNCSKPDGSGCDYSAMGNTSSANPFGLTGDPYSVTYSDQGKLTGNFDTRTYVPTIDPYQVQVPKKNFCRIFGIASISRLLWRRQYAMRFCQSDGHGRIHHPRWQDNGFDGSTALEHR